MPLFRAPPPEEGSTAPPPLLNERQRLAWLRLVRTPRVGPVTFWRLLNHFGGAEAALEALPGLMRRTGGNGGIRIPSLADVERERTAAGKLNAQLVARGEHGYPPLLARLDAPPPLLYVRGRRELASRPLVAIVGARNGSAVGQQFTRRLAGDLGNLGMVVVSGLARGIDTAAHTAAFKAGTIAIIAGGIDNIYPPQNRDLQQKIAAEGLLISENPPGFEPRAGDFPRRNRLIAGSALGTVVIEASKRSGSLITARLAGEMGRDVMAVPGHPLDPRADGTNRLIRDGATLVRHARDVVEQVGGNPSTPPEPPQLFEPGGADFKPNDTELSGSARARVLDALSVHPVAINELIRSTGLSAREVGIAIFELELAGRLGTDEDGSVRLLPA